MLSMLRAVLLALTHMYVVLRPSQEGGWFPPKKSCTAGGQHYQWPTCNTPVHGVCNLGTATCHEQHGDLPSDAPSWPLEIEIYPADKTRCCY